MALCSWTQDQIHFNVKQLMGLKTKSTMGKQSLSAVFAECKDVDADKFGLRYNPYECVKKSEKQPHEIKELTGTPYDERFKILGCPNGVLCDGCRNARESLNLPSAKLMFELECFGRPLGQPDDDSEYEACRPVPKFKTLPETYTPTSSLPVMPILREDLRERMDELLKREDLKKKSLASSFNLWT